MKSPMLAARLDIFSEYIFMHLNRAVGDVEKETGRKVLNFSIGNPDVAPSSIYVEKLTEFSKDSDAHLYPGYGAIPEFSEALRDWYKKRFAVEIAQDELLPLLGAKDGISHLPLVLLNEGDEVLVPDPGYPAFSIPAQIIGAKPVFYNLVESHNFKINYEELEEKISKKTKCMWVNFPSNPTGQVATRKEIEKIVAFAKKHNLVLLYDNAYSEITFDGFVAPSILEIEGARDVAVEIGSFSKSFSFAGFGCYC